MNKPREIVETINRDASSMSPKSFKDAVDSVMATSHDFRVLARLMWVAGMYLDRHPGAFQLPRQFAEDLLSSSDFDCLLAGLKAIRHSGASEPDVLAHFVSVLRRKCWDEKCAGVYQLGQLLAGERRQPKEMLTPTASDSLRTALADIVKNAPDAHDRELATRCITALKTIDDNRGES